MIHKSISEYFAEKCGARLRKIALNANLGCPNRDGAKERPGCIYCNNAAFNPSYAFSSEGSISAQLEAGIRFSAHKGAVDGYLPYFQTYSNTYGSVDKLIPLYEEALAFPGVRGLVLATRPDCLEPELLDYFKCRFGNGAPESKPFLLVELGIESTLDSSLRLIRRGHDYACAVNAVNTLHSIGIEIGAHLILGLPGEGEEDFRTHILKINELPISTLKLHQLQVIKGTALAEMYLRKPSELTLFTPESYADTVASLLRLLRKDIALDRLVSQTPPDLLLAPRWGIKPDEWEKLLEKRLKTHI